MTLAAGAIEPFPLAVPDAALDDLRERLARTRWPDTETVGDWSQGAPLAKVQTLCAYWQDGYDWRRCERMLNGFGSHRTTIDGLGVHFLHVRSPVPDALPMIMTHGWPGSVIEFAKVVGPLTDPAAHGGDVGDAFHLVLPSLPGYGFSDKPTETGWNAARIATAWATLVDRLGYGQRYVAQGGDWGAVVATVMARQAPSGCRAVHLNTLTVRHELEDESNPDSEVQAALDAAKRFRGELGYLQQQATRPQTLGYGLADSPAGQLAWIYEKLHAWSNHDGDVEALLGRDAILDNVMLYWLTNNGASAARLYWEAMNEAMLAETIDLPVGVTVFPQDTTRGPRRWAERYLKRLVHWSVAERGGHFGAFEQPAIFVDEVRRCFRTVR